MPSALETLVKILKLEREQGYKDTAVIGGLAAFSGKWAADAHKQARRPEHHLLVDELSEKLRNYEVIQARAERHDLVGYMLDRITGRVQPPAELQARLQEILASQQAEAAAAPPPTASEAVNEETPPRPPAQEQKEPKSKRNKKKKDKDKEKEKPKEKPVQQAQPAKQGGKRRQQSDEDEDDHPKSGFVDPDSTSYDDAIFAPALGSGQGNSPGVMDIPLKPRLARPPRTNRPSVDPEAAADILRGLSAPVTTLRGVGPRMAQLLEKLGIQTINDMLFFLPRRYDDYTSLTYITRLKPEAPATVIGTVRSTEVRIGRGGRKDFFFLLDDGSASLAVTFFGQHFLSRKIRNGQQIVVSGKTTIFRDRLQMSNPEWEHLDSENLHTTGIVPVYPLTEGLSPRHMRRTMKDIVDYWAERLPEYVPTGTLERAELADIGWTIKNLHFPESLDHLEHARRRYIFDELLLLQLAILANRRDWQSNDAPALTISDDFLETFIDTVFPYPLTAAQRRSIEDIRRDVTTNRPMNRLLQGDVGSGKTAVATTALAMAFANGKQAALMAPTGILAEQHYRNISRVLDRIPGERRPVIGLLTSNLSGTEREATYNGLRDGSIDIVVGTHAIIQDGVEFQDLAIAIIDEQHRFGVEQRKTLRGKGQNPHLLVMTATPIPRTLALTIYADLDLSIIDEMPPGRTPVQTRILRSVMREKINQFIEAQINQGRQAFIVHPLVEASDKIEAASAVEAYQDLSRVFHRYRVGLLHGRMKPAEKDSIMASFANHEFDIMVTTSVAEVGVDIPNASVIVIEDADRFGLAQLHQFRGRVGRGEHASYCLLVSDRDTQEAMERLSALELTTDGFRLAEIDWRLRGAGDLIGTRQSGSSTLQLMEQMTPELVELAQREARTIYEEDAYLSQQQHHLLAQRVTMLHNERTDVS